MKATAWVMYLKENLNACLFILSYVQRPKWDAEEHTRYILWPYGGYNLLWEMESDVKIFYSAACEQVQNLKATNQLPRS